MCKRVTLMFRGPPRTSTAQEEGDEPLAGLTLMLCTYKLTFDKPLSEALVPDYFVCFCPTRSLCDYNSQIASHRHL